MVKEIRFRNTIFLPVFVTLLLCFGNVSYAAVMTGATAKTDRSINGDPFTWADEREEKKPEYVPGEVLVKFKEGSSPQAVLESVQFAPVSLKRIYSITPVAARFKKDYKLEKDSNGWYSFLGKNYKEINDIPDEKAFEQAYIRMPETEKSLYRSHKMTLPEGLSVEGAVMILKNSPNVEYAQPNYIMKKQILPNDPYHSSRASWGQPYDDLWGLKKINCEGAWSLFARGERPGYEFAGEGVVVAVIDSGVDYNHEDLAANIWMNTKEIPGNGIDDDGNGYVDDVRGWNFVASDDNVMDDLGHGTHCAGTIAAVGNNNVGVIGVAPKAKIMPVKGLDGAGSGNVADLAQCIKYAADNGAQVLSNSWGPSFRCQSDPELDNIIDYAYFKGCTVVFAAGNSNDDAVYYSTANYSKTITVAAVNQDDKKCDFSNYGVIVDVAAPGGDSASGDGDNFWGRSILSLRSGNNGRPTDMYGDGVCIVGDKYYRSRGTSMACPHVAGLAALIISQHKDYDNVQVKWLIKQAVRPIADSTSLFAAGFGVIDAVAALTYPSTPPHLIADISAVNIDYKNRRVDIIGTAGGRDFWQYELSYQREGESVWHEFFVSPVAVEKNELCLWDASDVVPGKYVLCLSLITADGKESKIYRIMDVSSSIEPETIIFFDVDPEKSIEEGYPLGLYRPGEKVPLVGQVFGPYRLEWKSADAAVWRDDYFAYDQKEGYLGTWDTSHINDGICPQDRGLYYIRLVDGSDSPMRIGVRLDKDLKAGWPVRLDPVSFTGQIAFNHLQSQIGDVDGDGQPDIVALRSFEKWVRIYVFNYAGGLKQGWPKMLEGKVGCSFSTTLADINNDGKDEILIAAGYRNIKTLYCINGKGDIIFQRDFVLIDPRGTAMKDPILVCDLNNDGNREIVFRSVDKVYVLDANGNDIAPWPKSLEAGYPINMMDVNNMAVGIFDESKNPKLVIVQNEGCTGNDNIGNVNIHVFNSDGTYVQGWPHTIYNCYSMSSVVCGDADGDGYDEIIVDTETSNLFSRTSHQTYILGHDGAEIWVTNFDSPYSTCAYVLMADLNHDNKADVVLSRGSELGAWDLTVGSLSGWPVMRDYGIIPWLAVDVDGDGEIEIVGTNNKYASPGWYAAFFKNELVILSATGEVKSANPLNGRKLPLNINAMHFGDIDNDGFGELIIDCGLPVFAGDNLGYVPSRPCILAYKTEAKFNSNLSHWPTPHGDKYNSGHCDIKTFHVNMPPVITPIGNKTINRGDVLKFKVKATDPDNDAIRYYATGMPRGSHLNPKTGKFAWIPTIHQAGVFKVTFTAIDTKGNRSNPVTMTITVPNRPPILSPIGNKTIKAGQLLHFKITANDPNRIDNPLLRFYSDNLPKGANLSHNGVFTWIPTKKQAGTYMVKIYVKDPPGLTDEETVTISVR